MKRKTKLFVIVQDDLYSIFSPFFSLYVENGMLTLYSPLQRFEFRSDDIIDLVDLKGFPYIVKSALRIYHKRADYPSHLVIERNPDILRKFLEENGFSFPPSPVPENTDLIEGWPIFNALKIWGVYVFIGLLLVLSIYVAGLFSNF